MIKKALWVDCWSTLTCMKTRFKSVAEGRLQSAASYGTRDWSQDTAQGNRLFRGNTGKSHIVNGAIDRTPTHSPRTLSEAIAVLDKSLQPDVTVNSYVLLDILRTCLKQKNLSAAKQVHDYAIENRLENPHVLSSLQNVYIQCGGLLDARRVFDELKTKTIVNWNLMITGYAKVFCADSALELFNRMQSEGVRPNRVTYLCLLKAFASPLAAKWGKEVHMFIGRAGYGSDTRVGTALVRMYAKCGNMSEARRVFDDLTDRDTITWTIMIGAYAECGCGLEAYQLFLQMRREGFEPNANTYVSILNASASVGASEWVKEVHRHAIKAGLASDLRVGSALIHMYAKIGNIDDARLVFNCMDECDVFTWNIMIGGLAQHGCGHEAFQLFLQMKREGFKPNAITYISILNASASVGALEWVKKIHGYACEAGLESDLRVGSALIHMYSKSGNIDDARRVFDRMETRSVAIWNAMIGGLAQHGCGRDAYGLFLEMRREGFKPDAISYTSVLNASASDGALEWVKEVHAHATEAGMESDLRVGSALIHMYAKSGNIDNARLLFDRMEKRDVVIWNAMIGGLAQHGLGHEAIELFRKMNAHRVKPDGTSFIAVLSACCHAGLLDDGRKLFAAMTQDYDIEPGIVHHNCMVDLLGRAGHFDEAKCFINDMPVKPNAVTWKTLLGACKTYGNEELGEVAAEELFKLEPNDASQYVLLSNIYAATGKWEKVSSVRAMMQTRGVWKDPGRSWIEVHSKIHEFVVGDTSHPETGAIYNELHKLTEELKAEGYIPDTQLVLQNIDEEDKELALCSHSERLAIAYGLMHIPKEKPICIYKNLRVCPDCHTATKFISKVTGREIIARDAHRFHHFKDGVCSCGDYW